MSRGSHVYHWFAPGDINGFFGLIFDNLTVLSFLSGILIFVFKFPADIVFTRMFPGTAVGVLFGDLVYTWMAFNLSKKTGNSHVTAMPLGLDTPSTIGLALVVLGPAFVNLKAHGLPERDAAMMTWYIGMAVMMYMGVIKFFLSFFGNWVQKIIPKAGLLGSLAGIGLGLIGMAPLEDIFGMPLVGIISLGLIFYTLVAGNRLPWKIPGVFAAVVLGTALYYLIGPFGFVGGTYAAPPAPNLSLAAPLPTLNFIQGLKPALEYLPLAIPFALLTVVGGINVTESARVAGDDYNTRNILLTEAFATLIAGICGGVAQTTPYIGQPAYKKMGSRAGYTLLTAIFIGIGAMLGQISYIVELIPRAVLAPILIFVALEIIIQSFLAVPKRHAPAVALAFFPSVARLIGIELSNPEFVSPKVFNSLLTESGKTLPQLQVILALGNGFIITGMLWAAFLVKIIDGKLRSSAGYLFILAALSFFGIIHSVMEDGSMYLPWQLPGEMRQAPYQFATAYAALAILFLLLSLHRRGDESIHTGIHVEEDAQEKTLAP